MSPFKARRDELIKTMGKSALIVRASSVVKRSNDTYYSFRQNSNFYYLTGCQEPDAVLILCGIHKKSILFLKPQNQKTLLWDGPQMDIESALKELQVDVALELDQIDDHFKKINSHHNLIYLDLEDKNLQGKFSSSCQLKSSKQLIGKKRLIKDKVEIENMQKAAEITSRAFEVAMAFCDASKTEHQVQALLEYMFFSKGAKYCAYESIVAGGANALILHYNKNMDKLKKDQLLLIDAGSEVENYASDLTRTFPISGKFTPAQKEIYSTVLEAQKQAMELAIPGKTLEDIHNRVLSILTSHLVELGLLKGSEEQLLENKAYKRFYPHGTGHWLGLDVHDQCPYKNEEDKPYKLQEGMTFTIEPGLYIPLDSDIPKEFQGIGIRIEDDVLIQKDSAKIMTSAPKSIEEIEEICQKDYRKFLF